MANSVNPRRSPAPIVVLCLIVIAAVAFFLLRKDRGGSLPLPPPDRYAEMVSAFYTGTLALIVQDRDRPEKELKRATTIVPEEPAPWANLGLYYVRSRTRMAEAESALKKAAELAPNSSEVATLLGHFERERGKNEDARAHLERAVGLDPKNVHARYTLATLIADRLRPQDADSQFQKQIEGILAASPGNLVAILELGRTAARSNDSAALTRVIDELNARSAEWPDNVKAALAGLKAARTEPAAATSRLLVLQNLMRQQPAYLKSMRELKPLDNAVGVPLERFLRLPSPSPDPSPPDLSITFTDEPTVGGSGLAATFAILSPEIMPSLAENFKAKPIAESAGSILATDGKTLRVVTGERSSQIPFPAGGGPTHSRGIVTADLNYDFRPELILAGSRGIRIMKQEANGTFFDSTAQTKLPQDVVNAAADGVWIADIELDGDLDIVVGYEESATRILRNNGDGTFAVQTTFASIKGLRDFVWADIDGDGDPDTAFVDSKGKLTVLANDRSGRFLAWQIPDSPNNVTAIEAGDVDRDLAMDLVVFTSSGEITRLSDKAGGTQWDSAKLAQWTGTSPGAGPGSAGFFLADLDNNGGLDIIVSSAGSGHAWLCDEKGEYQALPTAPGTDIQSVGDLNGDGRMDVVAIASGKPVRRINKGAKNYEWIDLRPRATNVARGGSGDGRFSTFGVGGQIEIRSAALAQTRLIAGPNVHFGLGEKRKVDYARVIWPNGSVQGEFDLKPGEAVAAIQRLTGSCPWMFAWNGEKMEFVTDVLWKSPLGLRINAQDTAGVMTTEDWVKIRGDQLKPKDGFFDIRITGELWETHFFDHVSLMVVDHPADSEVYVDERFAFPTPPLKVHSVSSPKPIVKAVDDLGSDVSERVKSRDGDYLDTFGRGQYQGVTRDHYVDVEIPTEAAHMENICLVAFGWIHPTDSSINVALSQGSRAPPTGVSIEVPYGNGRWVVAKAGLGFPAGKNKTVLLDLSPVLKEYPGTTRFRLRTNLELFWDSIEWAKWKASNSLKTLRIYPTTADLRFRGYSATTQANESSPELPDYDRIQTRAQKWRDLIGYYTRFGDVRALLAKVDDRYVIMNAGDEMAFRFEAPVAPPAGWVRDFVLVSDGWEKDGNLNTGFSKTVLPLPSHSDPKYNTPPGRLEDDPVYRRYPRDWEVYHTRYVTPEGFRSALLPRIRN